MVGLIATSQSIDGLAEGLADVPAVVEVPVPGAVGYAVVASDGAPVTLFGGGAFSTLSPVGAPVVV